MANHAYWRGPDGAPHTKTKYAPTAILNIYTSNAEINAQGKVQWTNQDIATLKDCMMPYFLVLDDSRKELNSSDTWHIFRKSINALILECGGRKAISVDKILERAEDEAVTYFNQPEEKHTLVTALSIPRPQVQALCFEGMRLHFPLSRSNKFPYPDSLTRGLDENSPYWNHVTRTRYQAVYVHVQSQTPCASFEKADAYVNLYRALLNISATRGRITHSWRSGPHPPPALNLIRIAPIHTLHPRGGGSTPHGMYWYEPDFFGEASIPTNINWDDVHSKARGWLRAIGKLPYRYNVIDILIKYAEALDHHDYNSSCLKLWQILEQISGTVKYEELINRISWTYSDRGVVRTFLGSLRTSRNSHVHGLKSTTAAKQLAWTAKTIVEDHLLRLIANEFKIKSFDDYATILSMPTSLASVSKQAALYQQVANVLQKWQASAPD